MPDELELLRNRVKAIAEREGTGFDALVEKAVGTQPATEGLTGTAEGTLRPTTEMAKLEAVIRWSRPVLWIRQDKIDASFSIGANGPVDDQLMQPLSDNSATLDAAIPAIGRIELINNGFMEWAGTGWIVAFAGEYDIVATNAHVAELFGQQSETGFVFRPGFPDSTFPQSARIDFREEIGGGSAREFPITKIIWIAPGRKPDLAFLKVARTAGADRISPPLALSADLRDDAVVAAIGYPGDDSRNYDAEKFRNVFGDVFGIKRLAPGRLTGTGPLGLSHDCSTLPGNSGSVLWDVAQGSAVGLHYSGAAFRNNYAVPASEIVEIIQRRPWQGEAPERKQSARMDTPVSVTADGAISVTVPLEITLRLGGPALSAHAGSGQQVSQSSREHAEAAAIAVSRDLAPRRLNLPVLSVDADYLFRDGRLTEDFGVVVAVEPGASLDPADYGLSTKIDGVQIVVETADPQTIAEQMLNVRTEAFGGRQAGYSRDLGDPKFSLEPVTGRMKMVLHVSPESGWPVLEQFLDEDRYEQMTIGMYHMTAPHVIKALEAIAKRRRSRITLTLDRQRGDRDHNPDDISDGTKSDDIPERETLDVLAGKMKKRFRWAPASLGASGLFATAYHIKVAVWSDRLRGRKIADKAVWLSSGNWQSSNQAPVKAPASSLKWDDVRDYNREWHAMIEHAGLAEIFRNHLEQDFEDNSAAALQEGARGFELPDVLIPLTIIERPKQPAQFRAFEPLVLDEEITLQPLLTPDNYPEIVLDLVRSANHRLLIENQSFNLWKNLPDTPQHFLAIAEAVRERQQAGVDVRLIFRNIFGSEKNTMRRLKAFGIRTDPDHLRYFDTCHTKGMVVDDHSVLLGSHNLTAGGTGPNRDASLLIRNSAANAYFAELFEYDWQQLADNEPVDELARRLPLEFAYRGAESLSPGTFRRMSLAEFLGES